MHGREISAEGGAADVVEGGSDRTGYSLSNDLLQRRESALAVGLAEWHEANSGGDQIGAHGMQIGV